MIVSPQDGISLIFVSDILSISNIGFSLVLVFVKLELCIISFLLLIYLLIFVSFISQASLEQQILYSTVLLHTPSSTLPHPGPHPIQCNPFLLMHPQMSPLHHIKMHSPCPHKVPKMRHLQQVRKTTAICLS